ncbi:hypothetical protein EKD04_017580 [Chloroflexales bacterium ZM16-3]|nr:hypothetical protein [Chloroflexales bacterium ZM16-3]
MSCAWTSDDVDRELHAVGCCLCALDQTRPAQKRLSPEEARHLLGLFGFALAELDDGTWVAIDEQRGRRVPSVSGMGTDHSIDDLAGLVVRARCADKLAGPLTIAEATAQLATLGFTLHHTDHRWYGRQWRATSQDREASTFDWGRLASVVEAARSIVRQDLYRGSRQERMLELTRQMAPLDLEPAKPPTRTWTPATPPPGPGGQLQFDLDAPVVPKPWSPKRRRR